MKRIRTLFACLMVATASGCCQPKEQRVVHHVDPIQIEPIHIQEDINVRIQKDESASTATTKTAP